jgi:LemA protein
VGLGLWILIVLCLGAAVAGSRSLGSLRRQVLASWEQVEFLLGRRHALVRELVDTARGALPSGGEAWEPLDQALQRAIEACGVWPRMEAENRLTEALADRRAGAIGYADPALQALRRRLAVVEAEIATAAREYNLQVMALNQRIHAFPWRLLARGLRPVEYLVLDRPIEESTHPVPF